MKLLILLVSLLTLVISEQNEDLYNKFLTMPIEEFVEYFNKQNYSWTISENEHIAKNFEPCQVIDPDYQHGLPVVSHDPKKYKDLPDNFDSRQQWSNCQTIQEIYNQLQCGSCWTFGTASTASDRTCIHKNIQVRLSEEDFECFTQNVCNGNYPMDAFKYWQSSGLCTQECKPYDVKELQQNVCKKTCVNGADYSQDKHYGDTVYAVSSNVDDIKSELVQNGPIQAGFNVYEDFQRYNGGVYTYSWGKLLGGHSVRVIGYGVDSATNKNYWLAANSWGTTWGEQGYFRIQQEQQNINFESSMCTGQPKN